MNTQPRRRESSLADLIAQSEVRKATNEDEYMRTSNDKTVDLVMDACRDLESSSVQQSPVMSRLHDVMLPKYSEDLVGLGEFMHTQGCPESEIARRNSVTGADPEANSSEPKRQIIEDTDVSRIPLSSRTETEWEYMSSREERFVTLVPLSDACTPCEMEKRGKPHHVLVTEATNDPERDRGSFELTEQTPQALRTAAPDYGVSLGFAGQMRGNTACMQATEGSNAPEPDMHFLNIGAPEARNTQTLQDDGEFGINAPELDTHDPERPIDDISWEEANAIILEQFRDISPLGEGTSVPEPGLNRRLPVPERLAEASRQAKPSLESFKHRIHLLKLPPGIYPRKPSAETKVARQTQLPPQRFADRIDSLTLPDGAYLQSYSLKAQPAQIPIGSPSAPSLTPAYLTDSRQPQIASITDSQPESASITDSQPEFASIADSQGRARPKDPPSRVFVSWNSAEPCKHEVPLEIEGGGDSQLEDSSAQLQEPPTPELRPSTSTGVRRQLCSSETHGEKGSLNLTRSPRQQRSLEFGIEDISRSEGLRPSDLTEASQYQLSSEYTREGDARLNARGTEDFAPYNLTEAPQRQLSISWESCPQWADPFSQDITPFHTTEDLQQQRSSEASGENNPWLEYPLPQNLRPSYPTGPRRQQRWPGISGEDDPQWDNPHSQGFEFPRPIDVRQQQPSSSTREEDEPRLGEPPRQHFRASHPTSGNQRKFPEPPRQNFRPSHPTGDNQRKFPEPPRQNFRPSHPTGDDQRKIQKGLRQRDDSGDTGRQMHIPSEGPPAQSFPPPRSQQGHRPPETRADTGGRLVPIFTAPSTQSFQSPRLQKEATVREPLGETSKQGKAPPKSRPESHRDELSIDSRNNKRSRK